MLENIPSCCPNNPTTWDGAVEGTLETSEQSHLLYRWGSEAQTVASALCTANEGREQISDSLLRAKTGL